jgi:hypothetical protein
VRVKLQEVSDQAAVSGLQNFFVLAGGSAATLAGLLFVGLSMHLRIVLASAEVRSLALVTLTNFGAVLAVTLFMVIAEDRRSASAELVLVVLISIAISGPSLLAAARHRGQSLDIRRRDRIRLALRFGVTTLSQLALIAAALCLLKSLDGAFTFLIVSATVILLLVSLRNTWDLLVTVADVNLKQ